MAQDPRQRLGGIIQATRLQRWPNRVDFAEVCGLSVSTILAIERGDPKDYRPATLAKIEVALHWAEGDIDRIMEGGRPTTDPELQHVINSWPKLHAQVRAVIVGVVDDALAPGR